MTLYIQIYNIYNDNNPFFLILMIKQFSDLNSLNIVFMFKYMFCNTQNLTSLISAKLWQTNIVFTRITSVFIQFLDDWHEKTHYLDW